MTILSAKYRFLHQKYSNFNASQERMLTEKSKNCLIMCIFIQKTKKLF